MARPSSSPETVLVKFSHRPEHHPQNRVPGGASSRRHGAGNRTRGGEPLTVGLCAEAGRVIAVEIDPQLQPSTQETLGHCRNLDLRIGDALEFPFDSLPPRTVVVSICRITFHADSVRIYWMPVRTSTVSC